MFLLFALITTALAGSPGIFKGTAFFATPESFGPNSLESRVLQLKSIEKDFQSFTTDLLDWGKSYHHFRMRFEKEMLSEVLSHTGQSDFSKELGKCGVIDNLETEDMITVKNICVSSRMADDLVENLLKEVKTKADTCVNVKEKFRKRINDAYDEYFLVELDETIETDNEAVNILLQLMAEEKLFESLAKSVNKELQGICEVYRDLSNKISVLTANTDSILSTLF